MLTVGLLTEAVIFFFSAFEPIHDEVEWTLVYPELAGMTDEEEIRKYRKGSEMGGGFDVDDLKELIAGVVAATSGGSGGATPVAVEAGETRAASGAVATGVPGALIFTEKFNKMLENAEIGSELFDKVGKGLQKLSETSAKIANISDAAGATSAFAENMKKASDTVGQFSDNYQKNEQVLGESINILSESFQKTAGTVSESGQNFMGSVERSVNQLENQLSQAGETVSNRIIDSGTEVANQISGAATNLTTTYMQLADAMKANGEIISAGSSGYKENLEKLNKNMAALNAAHELHLQGTSEKLKEAQSVYSGVEGMMKKLKESVGETEKYAQSVAILNQNIEALNNVYGNMLSAMNVMSNGK